MAGPFERGSTVLCNSRLPNPRLLSLFFSLFFSLCFPFLIPFISVVDLKIVFAAWIVAYIC